MGDLAEVLALLPSRVTRQIRRLEANGLVQRTTSPEDGRGVLAGITEVGREAVRQIRQLTLRSRGHRPDPDLAAAHECDLLPIG